MSSSGLQTIPRKELFSEGDNVTFVCSHELRGRNYSSICTGLNTWEPPLPTCPRMYVSVKEYPKVQLNTWEPPLPTCPRMYVNVREYPKVQ